MKKTVYSLAGILLLSSIIISCGQNPTAPQSTLQLSMTTTSSAVTQQMVIQALPTTGTAYYSPEIFIVTLKKIELSQDGSSWENLWEGSQQYDIATGQAIDPINGPVVLPEGEYKGIRFTIGDNITGQTHVDGDLVAGTLSDFEGDYLFTTINGKLNTPINISGANPSSVTFSFDITNTLGYNADTTHWFIVKPVCTANVD